MPSPVPQLVWLRRDLRLHDNPALAVAAASGAPVIPVFIAETPDLLGGASRWWRGRSLAAFAVRLSEIGSRLILREGPTLDEVMALLQETGARHLHINRRFEPDDLATDSAVIVEAGRLGIEVHEHRGNRLHEPWALKTLKGDPFRAFTPFWRRLAENYRMPPECAKPETLAAPKTWPKSLDPNHFAVVAKWGDGFTDMWTPGEAGAAQLFKAMGAKQAGYVAARNIPAEDGTSRLSPHLAWGEIGVHAIWRRWGKENPVEHPILRELGWRDFNTHLLYHFPKLPNEAWSAQFRNFPWAEPGKECTAWQKGRTGYPIVDAGMRQLWRTGWMHNRLRMIVASFLIKDLLIDWREGQAWFWDTLVDADLAQNAGNWQWVAGSGADAAPYFRIFNPTTQSAKFDPDGAFIRRFVPELARLPARYIHHPATAPAEVLAAAGIRLGKDYPEPVVDHAKARERALAIYRSGKPPGRGDLF